MARLLTDEDFPRSASLQLRALGHDVATCLELGLANLETPDESILATAIAQEGAVVTHNRKHYLRLHRERPSHCGIVICTHDLDRVRLARNVHAALEAQPTLLGVLIRVNRSG